jgi:signal transduction histidine kinase
MPDTNGQRAGGRRGPSIRRLLYFLVAIPLLTVIGLYAFVLYTTVGDAVNLDRAPNLINATSVPAAQFDNFIQNERRASMVYLAAPTPANRAQLTAAQAATVQNFPAFRAGMTSAATTQAATTGETNVINKMINEVQQLSGVRSQVDARAITPAAVMATYGGILTDELNLFLEENGSLTNSNAAVQSLANIDTVEARELLSQEDAVVSATLAAGRLTTPTRVQLSQLAGARAAMIQAGLTRLDASGQAAFNRGLSQYATPAALTGLTSLEQAIAADNTPFPPFTAAQWNPVATAVLNGYFAGGVDTARQQVANDNSVTNAAWRRVALAGGVGLLGLLLSIGLSVLIGRWIIRRLGRLEESAVTLAGVELPNVVARLRRGEDVPVEELTGARADFGRDEIGRVGQAFDAARRTAIEAAVGEARMRRGINDVFRNLARRNQSLLHRELTVLDGMERRTTDPETLEDLFRLDHLTTRMRRHSEGLIILSGAAPGRGWVHPVRMIDVLRAAAAEVEDYSRVTVTTPSQAALTGPAVADVIHLLAELIENATTLSPPYTPVRVSGDMVASGFAVEIEDRGLGMSEQRYAELNGRLAEPPEFDVFNSEQLGLFVVGQLAKRHGIRVTLRPSPYGGTSAIALIPTTLVGVEDGFVEGLPAGMSAISSAWAAGRSEMPGDNTRVPPSSSRAQLTGQPWSALPQGNGSSGTVNGDARVAGGEDPFGSFAAGPSNGTDPYADQSYPDPSFSSPANGTAVNGAPSNGAGTPYSEQPYGTDPNTGQAYGWMPPPDGSSFGSPGEPEAPPTETGLPWPYDRPAPGRNSTAHRPTAPFAASDPGYPPGGTYRPYAQDETPFPPPGASFPTPQAPLPPAEPPYPQAQPSYSETEAAFPPASTPYPSAETAYPAAEPSFPPAGSLDGADGAQEQPDETYKGLPKRVRQANLAPQLRDRTTPSGTASAASGENVANRSPDDIRNALSAMQRGWQRARGDESSPGQDGAPAASGAYTGNGSLSSGSDEGTVPGEERLVTDEERTAAQGTNSTGNGSAGGHDYSDDYGSGYGTADPYGVGSVGYPDYAAEPDYSAPGAGQDGTDPSRSADSIPAFRTAETGSIEDTGGDTAHNAEAETNGSHDEQGYRGGNDDI